MYARDMGVRHERMERRTDAVPGRYVKWKARFPFLPVHTIEPFCSFSVVHCPLAAGALKTKKKKGAHQEPAGAPGSWVGWTGSLDHDGRWMRRWLNRQERDEWIGIGSKLVQLPKLLQVGAHLPCRCFPIIVNEPFGVETR